jgi:hypothetical protein
MIVPAKDASEVHKYGSTVHIIAACKVFDANILIFSHISGWTLYTPDIEVAPSPTYKQHPERPTFPILFTENHFNVILEI